MCAATLAQFAVPLALGLGKSLFGKKKKQSSFPSFSLSPEEDATAHATLLSNLHASNGLADSLNAYNNQYFSNPQQTEQKAIQTARDYMQPAYERNRQQGLAQLVASLGNRNFSTFGTLTQNDRVNQDAISGAQNEYNIFNAGQDYLDKTYNRGQTLASILGTSTGSQNQALQTLLGPVTSQQQAASIDTTRRGQTLGLFANALYPFAQGLAGKMYPWLQNKYVAAGSVH